METSIELHSASDLNVIRKRSLTGIFDTVLGFYRQRFSSLIRLLKRWIMLQSLSISSIISNGSGHQDRLLSQQSCAQQPRDAQTFVAFGEKILISFKQKRLFPIPLRFLKDQRYYDYKHLYKMQRSTKLFTTPKVGSKKVPSSSKWSLFQRFNVSHFAYEL
jgi:hypothetical protein